MDETYLAAAAFTAAWAPESGNIEAEMSVRSSLRREICDVILVPGQIDVRSAEPHQMQALLIYVRARPKIKSKHTMDILRHV